MLQAALDHEESFLLYSQGLKNSKNCRVNGPTACQILHHRRCFNRFICLFVGLFVYLFVFSFCQTSFSHLCVFSFDCHFFEGDPDRMEFSHKIRDLSTSLINFERERLVAGQPSLSLSKLIRLVLKSRILWENSILSGSPSTKMAIKRKNTKMKKTYFDETSKNT